MNDTEFYRAPKPEQSNTDDARLVEAVRRYEIALQNGERPVRAEYLAEYPDVASELANCIDGLEFLLSTAPDLRTPQAQVAAPPPLQMGGTLGDFRLIREIGRGGMGIVYEAWQNSLNRRVALKVLLYAATLDARQLRRFENEARASAHLHHSNIVPVFAVGCERGIHFYAMQIIDGQTLAEMIDELCKQSGPGLTVRQADSASLPPPADIPSESGKSITASSALLPAATLLQQSVRSREFFRTIAHLGVQAASAMEYAHQMGVVHRDIKPANLLVDKRGNLWITDFGLARFQAAPGMTAPGDIIGTLRYMSPEQATGKPVIDPRSDVYALGATLYEIATLEPAFAADNRQACLLQIIEEDPIAPRKWNSAIPTDLETIILKAMAKSPEDRYPSAAALADDLQRFLEDRPILARRPSLRERLSKWTRRHRNLVASGVLGLVFAVLILAVTTWRVLEAEADLRDANLRLAEEKERTDAARQKEADQHARAAKNYQEARKVLDFLTRLGEEGRIDRREYLEKLLNYYQEFIEQHQDDPGIRDELVQTQYHIAGILDQVGSKADAIAMYELARKEQEKMRFPGRPDGPPGGPPHFDRGSWLGFLVLQSAVQKDLKLTDDQIAVLKKSIDLKRGPFRNPEEDHQAEKVVQDTLSSEQLVRLRQIGRQQRAVHALGDTDTADLLALDSNQQEKIRKVLDDARKTMFRQRGPGGRNAEKKDRDQSWKEVNDKLLEILNTEQKAKWKELLGPPFKGEMRLGPPPGGPHGDFRPKLAP